ncbi:hypothetical protein DFAR_3990029 [Desulfarculales bacterium]
MEQRFLKILRLATVHSKAYGQIFDQAGNDAAEIQALSDLPRLPILHMGDLVFHHEQNPPFGGLETKPTADFHRIYVNPGFIWQTDGTPFQDTS